MKIIQTNQRLLVGMQQKRTPAWSGCVVEGNLVLDLGAQMGY